METIHLSKEEYVELLEMKLKLKAVIRFFETSKYGLGRDDFYQLTGFDITQAIEEEKK